MPEVQHVAVVLCMVQQLEQLGSLQSQTCRNQAVCSQGSGSVGWLKPCIVVSLALSCGLAAVSTHQQVCAYVLFW